MSVQVYVDGNLSEEWDDDARLYKTFSSEGVELTSRAYSPEENAEADSRIEEASDAAVESTLRTEVEAIKTDLIAEKDRAQLIIDKSNAQITAADTKDLARAAKRIADAAISIAKLLEVEV